MELKTIEPFGTVLYNSGSDFIALEVEQAHLRFLVGKGSNVLELVSDRNVSDGHWHNVSIAYSPYLLEVRISAMKVEIANYKYFLFHICS